MEVAHLTPYFPPHLGGVEFHVKELSLSLEERGHEVEVFTTDVPGGGDGSGLEVTRFGAVALPYMPVVPRLSSKLEGRLEGFDAVHSHLPPPFFTAAAPESVPHVATYHCDFEVPGSLAGIPVPGPLRSAAQSLYRWLYGAEVEGCDAVVATTESYAETSPLLRGLDYRVVPNGVRPDRFRYSEEKEPYLLFVGRLASSKGVEDLVEAAPGILERTELEEVRIVGEGEEERSLRREVRRNGLEGEVRFLGSLSLDALVEQYGSASATVLPSKSRLEAFGLVQLESMASGTPVVASDSPGVNEVIEPGATGELFEPGETAELAEAVEAVVSWDTGETARTCRERVAERFTWERVAEEVETIYEDIA